MARLPFRNSEYLRLLDKDKYSGITVGVTFWISAVEKLVSDESFFTHLSPSGQICVKSKNAAFDARCHLPDVKHGFGSELIQTASYCKTLVQMIALHDCLPAERYETVFIASGAHCETNTLF